MRRLFIATFIFLVMAPIATAAERVTVCAKYAANYGWSKGYEVQATVLDGSELNEATNSYTYQTFGKYVVIFWAQHEASVIKMNTMLPLGPFDQDGVDQRGVNWEISEGGACY